MNAFQRTYKRFTILLVVTLVVAGIVLLFYGVIGVLIGGPPPTCTDNIQNQGEEGVDCGGPCELCLLKTISPIEVREVNVISTLPGFADVVVWLDNPNTRAGATRVTYKVFLMDDQGQVGSLSGEGFLLPGSTQFFVHQKVPVSRFPLKGDVQLEGVEWQLFDRQPQVTLEIRDDVLFRPEAIESIGWQFRGVVHNASSFDLDVVGVATVLRDADDRIVAAGSHEIRTLRSGEDRAFLISWPVGEPILAVTAQSRATTNIFSNLNILLEYGAGELRPFQKF